MTESKINIKNIKKYENVINIKNTKYSHLKNLLPKNGHTVLEFEINNINCAMANAIRRTLTNELSIKFLTCSLEDIKSSDKNIIDDQIKSRLEMIPIDQNIDTNSIFNLKVENNEDTYNYILSNEIKNNKNISANCIEEIPICSINSGKWLYINNICVKEEYGYNNGRVSPCRIEYEIINHNMNVSSLISNPTDYKFLLECPYVIDPNILLKNTFDNLISRLQNIDLTKITVEYEVYKLHIVGETHTIGRLISRYIYELVPTIDYVNMRIIHPSKRECVIDIRHPEAKKILIQSVNNIIKDLNIIKKLFKY